MKQALRQRARELGFDDCRVTTANAPESAARFKQWLAEGRHGEMAWIERNAQKRVDPQQVLPGARSVIVLAASYHDPNAPTAPVPSYCALRGANALPHQAGASNGKWQMANGKFGLIARYARYRDYHDVLGERLKQLAEFVNGLGGRARARCGMWTRGRCSNASWRSAPGWASSANIPTSSAANWGTGSFSPKSSPRWTLSRIAGGEPLRLLRALHCRVPDGGHHRAVPTRCPALHLLPDHRAERSHTGRASPGDRRPHLRLRRLPPGLPLEPVRPRRAHDEDARAPRPGTAGLTGLAVAGRSGV